MAWIMIFIGCFVETNDSNLADIINQQSDIS
jgi:hypothetical protein